MIALVTGVSGFLGARVCAALLEARWEVRGVSRSRPPSFNSGFTWLSRDLSQGLEAQDAEGVDVVFHLAGANGGAKLDRAGFARANEFLLGCLLQACAKVPRIVHASSQVVYGDPGSTAITEDFPLVADTPYAASKIESETDLRRHGGVCVALRLTGFLEGGGAPTLFLESARAHKDAEVLSNGAVKRDYLGAEDGARAFVLAAEKELSPGFHAYNIGSGDAVSTLDLAKLIYSVAGSRGAVVPVDRPAPRKDLVLDISKARRDLGFAPRPLEKAVRAFIGAALV